jgi:hypothetical protein
LNIRLIARNNISRLAMYESGRCVTGALQHLNYHGISGLIFVVDSNDRERISEARHKLILNLANKQDLSNSMTLNQLRDELIFDKLNRNTKWHLQPACAIQNKGLWEGFKWLANSIVQGSDSMKLIVEIIDDIRTMKEDFMSIFSKLI